MTDQERIQALVDLGYTEREAAFLVIAALHSGYFLRRQFLYFAGVELGAIAQAFIDRTTTKKHCKANSFRHDRVVYHVGSKPLFQALGDVDNRNRRDHDVSTIKARLMGLDYVLQRLRDYPKDRFLPTESEKVSFFAEELGLPPSCLPVNKYRSTSTAAVTDRYFVDKFPLYIPAEEPGSVRFCYIDPGQSTVTGFENHAYKYEGLWARLRRFSVIYIAASKFNLARARTAFDRLILNTNTGRSDDVLKARLVAHFRMRAAFESGDRTGFTQHSLIELRRDLRLYVRFEAMYQSWLKQQETTSLGFETER
jgi:hypothetical protein